MAARKRLAWLVGVGILCGAGIALAQDTQEGLEVQETGAAPEAEREGAPLAKEVTEEVTPKAPAPGAKKKVGGMAVEELSQVARVVLNVKAGSRWQVERPLETNLLYLVLNPPPSDLARQLKPYRSLGGLKVGIERNNTQIAILRIEQPSTDTGPLLSSAGWRGRGEKGALGKESDLGIGTQKGIVESDGQLLLNLGRVKRFSAEADFCRFVQMPLNPPVPEGTQGLDVYRSAEAHFIAGELDAALSAYKKIAMPLKEVESSDFIKGSRAVHLNEVAALRIGDVQICRGARKSALLRYEILRTGRISSSVKVLAGFKWIELAWPTVAPGLAKAMFGELPTSDGDPLVARITLQAVRVMLMTGAPRGALDRLAQIDPSLMKFADNGQLKQLRDRALIDAINIELKEDDLVGLVVVVKRNREMVWKHPQGRAIAIEVGSALRRLGLPEESRDWLQVSMEKLKDASDDVRLLGELARAYREAGDIHRGERTIRYLVERLKEERGWLGRAQEVTISLAATEIALDARQWKKAMGWLERAMDVGGGASVHALYAYVKGLEALERGEDEDAAQSLLKAASLRKYITPYRRAEVCLKSARVAAKVGRGEEAKSLLRVFMEETRNADVEIEVAFELANHFETSGDKARARALYEDVSLRQPEGTYGRLAATRARLLAFGEKHSALLSEVER